MGVACAWRVHGMGVAGVWVHASLASASAYLFLSLPSLPNSSYLFPSQGVVRLGGLPLSTVLFMGDSTARQQVVSLCCLLRAGAAVGAPYTWRLLVNRQFQSYRCAVTLAPSSSLLGDAKVTIAFDRINRADSFEEGRPPEITPRLNPRLWSAAHLQRPTVLVINLGAWEYEDGCVPQLHSLHDTLCDEPGQATRR